MLKNIAICHTKPGYNGDVVIRAFKNGLQVHGDNYVEIKYFNELDKINSCDAVFMISYPDLASSGLSISNEYAGKYLRDKTKADSVVNIFRTEIYKKCHLSNKRLLCLDSGVLNFQRNQRADENVYQLGWDKIKGLGVYYNTNSPSDRFDSLHIEVKPWRYDGNYTLMFGQVKYGVGSQHINIVKWQSEMINEIVEINPKEQIVIRSHPNCSDKPFQNKKQFRLKYTHGTTIANDLSRAKFTLSFSSHSIVESVIHGVPSFCFSELSMGHPLFYVNNIQEVFYKFNNKQMPTHEEVMQWLYNLAYTQWSVSEISSGEAWHHLQQGVLC